jgi:hypothetical protein
MEVKGLQKIKGRRKIKRYFSDSRSQELRLTPYSRFGAFAPRSGPELDEYSMRQLAVARKLIQPDTPAPPNRVAASRFAPLGWWGVVNTRTLCEIRGESERRITFEI